MLTKTFLVLDDKADGVENNIGKFFVNDQRMCGDKSDVWGMTKSY